MKTVFQTAYFLSLVVYVFSTMAQASGYVVCSNHCVLEEEADVHLARGLACESEESRHHEHCQADRDYLADHLQGGEFNLDLTPAQSLVPTHFISMLSHSLLDQISADQSDRYRSITTTQSKTIAATRLLI